VKKMPFLDVDEALEIFKNGKMLIMVDDEDRENEGDLIIPAETANAEAINFMAMHGRGLVCISCTKERAGELNLDLMVPRNTSKLGTNFTISVDAKHGTTTGISASDRAKTVKVFIDPDSTTKDLSRPGHIFPICARNGGVLERAGHTEGSVDLCRMAGLYPAGVMCEIMKEDGEMARLPDLKEFAKRFNLGIVSIRDIIARRMQDEKLVKKIVSTHMPNDYGMWTIHLFEGTIDKELHIALVMGEPEKQKECLVRVHSQCFTGDTLGSLRCDCGPQLNKAQELIKDEGHGVILYMHQEGRGIGLKNKLLAYALQEKGLDTVEANEELGFQADLREYGIGAQILSELGLKKIRLMTNNPKKIIGISGYGLEIVGRIPIIVGKTEHNERYLKTKESKLGHLLSNPCKCHHRGE
jgi:3,4-dihydroxy 2-butanone 4-phosphate synthase / GTP cyclohydrolase II